MKSELNSTINEVAHSLAARSFNAIRQRLREQARAMLKQGKKLDEVIAEIQVVDLRGDLPRQ